MSSATMLHMLSANTIVSLVLKVTLILAVAATLTVALCHRSAALRHYVWALALGAALGLAALAPALPTLPVRIGALVSAGAAPNAVIGSVHVDAATAAIASRGTAVVNEAVPAPAVESADGPATVVLLVALWASGVALVLGRLALGHVGLARLTRHAELVRDAAWRQSLAHAGTAMGVTRSVRLLRSGAVGAPITWGTRRPVVVLPLEARDWSAERRDVVLQHELAHIARHDYVTQILASVTCAVYWFHPLVWFAARRLRGESERACDDQVLLNGTLGTDYASHLLSLAGTSRALRLTGAVAIGMARSSALEGRLLAVLNPAVVRGALSPRVRRAGVAALCALLAPVAALRAVPREAPASAPPTAHEIADSTIERVIDVAAGQRLFLDLGPGGDVLVRGWDQDRVQVRVTLAGQNWRDVTVDIARDPDGVTVRSRYDVRRGFQSTRNRYEVRVPRRFDVRLSSGGGNLTIYDVEGEFSGTSGGGEIMLERLRGRASLSTGGGDVRVHDVHLEGRVSTGGGMVTLSEVDGNLRGYSGSGPIVYGTSPNARNERAAKVDLRGVVIDKRSDRVTVEPGSRAGSSVIHITKAGGDVRLDEAPAGAVIQTGGGRIVVGSAAGTVDASTGGGDIDIGPVAGSVRAGTGAGTVKVALAAVPGEEQSVEIHAGVGRVILEIPASFAGTFDLETAYTRNFRRATRIESDWELDRSTTSEWDDREGTPRRYVRAGGSVGRGSGRIYVKTANGDIEVRRTR